MKLVMAQIRTQDFRKQQNEKHEAFISISCYLEAENKGKQVASSTSEIKKNGIND